MTTAIVYYSMSGNTKYAADKIAEKIQEIKLISENEDGTKKYMITATEDVDLRKNIFDTFAIEGITIFEMKKSDATLEDAFMQLINSQNEAEEVKNEEEKVDEEKSEEENVEEVSEDETEKVEEASEEEAEKTEANEEVKEDKEDQKEEGGQE